MIFNKCQTSLWLLLLLLAAKWWLIVSLSIIIYWIAGVSSRILVVGLNVCTKCGVYTLLVALICKVCTTAL